MSDFYIKPGNQNRGWNDPPQFSYGLQTSTGGQKQNILNKRVSPPQPTTQHPESELHPVVCSATSTNSAPPPIAGFTPPPKSHISGGVLAVPAHSSKIQPDCSVQLQGDPDLKEVQAPLFWALATCQKSLKKQVCDEVARRLKIFEEMWTSGKLSLPVRHRMLGLSQELSKKNWDGADEIHRALMVDYVSEVSQWMVGVKRLIAETRNLSPELVQTEVTAQSNASAGPVQ